MVNIVFDKVGIHLARTPVVHDVSADLQPGALIGVIGPNGAGKSTLIRAALGLLPHSSGQILIDGVSVKSMKSAQLARHMSYLPQGQTLHWPLQVERVVALGRLPHMGVSARLSPADQAAIDDAMDRTHVRHLAHRNAQDLSGGERARVLLARALAVGAPALIVDEPLAALDPGHQMEVMTLLQAEARAGALVVAVLHDLTLAARYCDRLLLIDQGRLVADGAPTEVLTDDNLANVYGITVWRDNSLQPPLIVPHLSSGGRFAGG